MALKVLTLKRGDTLALTVTYKDSAGDPINIAGFGIAMQARSQTEADTVLAGFDLSVGLGITITDAANGVYTVGIVAATTANFTLNTYNVDIQYTDAATAVKSTETFTLEVIEDITK